MPGGKRLLPRFEVIRVRPRQYCAYDHKLALAHWGAYPSSIPATQAIVDMLTLEAEAKGQETEVLREETPAVKRPVRAEK